MAKLVHRKATRKKPPRPRRKSLVDSTAVWIILAIGGAVVLFMGYRKLTTAISFVSPGRNTLFLLITLGLIALVIALINKGWYPSSETMRTTAGKIAWGKLLAATVVIFLLLWAGKQVQRWKEGGLVVGRQWSPVIRIPPGKQVIWDPRENVAHEIRTESGTDYPFPRRVTGRVTKPCERLTWINEASATIQIRVTDPDVKETIFDLTFMPYQEGGPCGGETRATPLPSRTLPFLPLVPPLLKDDAKM